MKKAICLICMLVVTGIAVERGFAASGKCTVLRVEGTQMVIECEKKTKGFPEGSRIKIKSVNKKAIEGC